MNRKDLVISSLPKELKFKDVDWGAMHWKDCAWSALPYNPTIAEKEWYKLTNKRNMYVLF